MQASDLGNNFFLDFASLGKSRAEATTHLLNELNEFVNGTAVDKDAEAIIEEDVSFFGRFTLVIATNVSEKALLKLAAFLYAHNIPLFACRSYGFVGYLRLTVPEHTSAPPLNVVCGVCGVCGVCAVACVSCSAE